MTSQVVVDLLLRVRVGVVFSTIYLYVIIQKQLLFPKYRENNTKKHILLILIKPRQSMGLLRPNTRPD
jgi:hypothetical protein